MKRAVKRLIILGVFIALVSAFCITEIALAASDEEITEYSGDNQIPVDDSTEIAVQTNASGGQILANSPTTHVNWALIISCISGAAVVIAGIVLVARKRRAQSPV